MTPISKPPISKPPINYKRDNISELAKEIETTPNSIRITQNWNRKFFLKEKN
jgi:adenylyl- and sulfurtransferase ThiI